MKKKYSRFRELWSVPQYRTLFKLGGYLLFFIIFFTIAGLGPKQKPKENQSNSTSYNTMKKDILESNLEIKYTIGDYYLEGTIIDNILSSTLEKDDEIKKIKIIEDKIYLVQKNEEILDDNILKEINLIYLFPKNIINILNNNSSLMKQSEDQKTYSYTIDNKAYSVYTDKQTIRKIIIYDGFLTYTLEYSIIN